MRSTDPLSWPYEPLVSARAFLVQIGPQALSSPEAMQGQAEHLGSGANLRFSCLSELAAFLAEGARHAGPPGPTAPPEATP